MGPVAAAIAVGTRGSEVCDASDKLAEPDCIANTERWGQVASGSGRGQLLGGGIDPWLTTNKNVPALSRVMDAFEDLVRHVPAYDLGFLPDKSALDLIKKTV